jgi:hypothetical protein
MIPVYVSSPANDTHAANLTGSDTHALATQADPGSGGNKGSTGSANFTVLSTDRGSVETTEATLTAFTPDSAVNKIACVAIMSGLKITNAGTITLRIKEGAGTLFSVTSASVGINAPFFAKAGADYLTNQTAASHTYTVTGQASTTGYQPGTFSVDVFPVSMTGSDTHGASLSGSAGTCVLT